MRITQNEKVLGPARVPDYMHNALMDIAYHVENAHKVARALRPKT